MWRAMMILGAIMLAQPAIASTLTLHHARVSTVKGRVLTLAVGHGWHLTKESESLIQVDRDDTEKPQTWRLTYTLIQTGTDVLVSMDVYRIWHSTYGDDELIPVTNEIVTIPMQAEMLTPLGAGA